jgi:hypothetical protein
MKIVFFIIAIVVLIGGASIGCAVDTPSAPATSPFATITYVDQKDAAEVATRTAADTALVNADASTAKQIADLTAKIGAGTATNSYTKDEINAKFNTLIANLTDDQISQLKTKLGVTTITSPYGTPTTPIPSTGQVTWVTNPTTLPIVYSGLQSLTAGTQFASSVPTSLCSFSANPSGYVQPYTMRITNSSSVIQYVKPVITISQATSTGYYYGGQYPQLVYYNLSISSGMGMVQGTGISHFYHKNAGGTPAIGYWADVPGTVNFNGWYPSSYGTFTPLTISSWILQNGWWLNSSTNPVSTSASNPAVISGAFPISVSPANANTQSTPSFTFTTTAPALNGYGEYQLSPGQMVDIQISLQVGTLQQATLQIQTTVSYRQ